jgi:hypothetical protein
MLKMAQTLGERQALPDSKPGRLAITSRLDKDIAGRLEKPVEVLT